MKAGKVYIVGAGPGDPGLLTLRAKEVLSRAEVVLYDALIHSRILEFIPETALKLFRGNRNKKGALSQDQINALLIKLAKQGKMVVRLKGGDPFVFGRGAEETLALLKNGIQFEIVPGVTSAVAVPAYAGIPVTHRSMNSSFTVVTGHEDPEKPEAQIDWKGLAQNDGTLIFLMGLHTLSGLCERLMGAGKSGESPVAVIQWGTTPQQRTVFGTLSSIAETVGKAGLKPPATVVIGEVVTLAEKLRWFHRKPLEGCRILITRTRDQASFLSGSLAEKGAEMVEIPTIEISPLPATSASLKRVRNLSQYDWIVFSSVNAVEIFMSHLFNLKRDARHCGGVKIACVGEATAKSLRGFGLVSDVVPKDYKQEGLVQVLKKIPWNGKRVLLARGKEGREILSEFFKKKGAVVDAWVLYENRVPEGTKEKLRRLFMAEGGVDLLTFASSSSVDHFYGFFTTRERKKWLRVPVAVIGPVTASSVRKWGGRVAIQPKKYTMPDLVTSIVKWALKHPIHF